MPDLNADKKQSTLLVLFIPSADRFGKSLGKKGNGVYQIPGLCKIVRKNNPPKPAREGTDPRTGEKVMFKAKPASTTVKVRALKNLKDMVK